jgi:general secretion pathway protein A
MYEEYFGLTKKPFSIVPDPRYFYMSSGHREALAHLMYGIKNGGGFVLLTGEVGTGKTTVCRRLLEVMPEDIEVAFILNPKLSVEELLATICDEFRIIYPEGNTSVKVFVELINEYLLEVHSNGKSCILIIEEAQNLKPDVLEQIRLLTNLETSDHKLLQMVMLGQPELRELLQEARFLQLSQRITSRYHLGPLSRGEVYAYVNYRLSVAGLVRGELFSPAVLKRLYKLSGGVPRLINLICDRALLGAYVQGKEKVDIKTLTEAVREISGEDSRSQQKQRISYFILACLLFVLLAVLWIPYFTRKTTTSVIVPDRPIAQTPAAGQPKEQAAVVDALKRPAGLTADSSKEMAYQALCNQWNLNYNMDKSQSICEQAQKQGLRCFNGKGSISDLRQMNRPAVLRFVDDNNIEYFLALTALKEDTASFYIGKEVKVVDVKGIARWWTGDYLILWRPPPGYKGKLNPGDHGPMASWLDQKLAALNGRATPVEPQKVYSGGMVKEVKELQITAGLIPDGVVGYRTIMYLNSVTGGNEPYLNKIKGEN